MRAFLIGLFTMVAQLASADVRNAQFPSIDGGLLKMSDWDGQPVLVVNTASQCAYTGQYEELQALYDAYRDDGLVVLAVPSDAFRQELDSAAEVREFCEMAFGLDMPMTDILPIRGEDAHPFYRAVQEKVGFVPRWNFNKILIGADGAVLGTWGARAVPTSHEVTRAVEAALADAES